MRCVLHSFSTLSKKYLCSKFGYHIESKPLICVRVLVVVLYEIYEYVVLFCNRLNHTPLGVYVKVENSIFIEIAENQA